jgi:hypothetical protein
MRLLLMPSSLSGALVIAAAIVMVGGAAWSYVTNAQLFYDVLFGYRGIATALVSAPDAFILLRSISASPIMYYLMLLTAGVGIGFIIFELLQWISRPHHLDAPSLQETLTKLLVRLLALAGWGVYIAFFVSLLVPFITLLIRLALEKIPGDWPVAVFLLLCALSLQIIAVHIHTVFARLVLLRPRIFGGWDLEEATVR